MEHRFGFAWFVGTGISDPFDCFSPKRDAGRFAGAKLTGRERAEQKECCDKFVTSVTELLQSKALAKCQKPSDAMRPEGYGWIKKRRRARRRQTAAIRFRVSRLRRDKKLHGGGMKRTGWQDLQERQDGFLDRINRIYRIGVGGKTLKALKEGGQWIRAR